VLEAFEARFAKWLPEMKWVNFGGGHHITSPLYDRNLLIETLRSFKGRYPNLTVYLEPGEAIAINTGILLATVLDIIPGKPDIAILDISATCHMPDVLEMPYRPEIFGTSLPDERAHTYRLGGLSCLAGDVVGDYSFDQPLQPGNHIQFLDMAHYTMVKTTTFNGIKHPSIATWDPQIGELNIVREFGYEDYKNRLS
jgi:carboxynorspermidine decarboxylase